jgi:hypothetical protein
MEVTGESDAIERPEPQGIFLSNSSEPDLGGGLRDSTGTLITQEDADEA